MGYTHYFEFSKIKGNAQKNEISYQRAILDCQKVIKYYSKKYGGLSGYSAHTKLGQYGGILVNGKGSDAHEDFALREHFNQNESFNFCKTARKEYDTVIVACLTILKHRLSSAIDVSSDGNTDEWSDGVALAKKVTKLKIKNPIINDVDNETKEVA